MKKFNVTAILIVLCTIMLLAIGIKNGTSVFPAILTAFISLVLATTDIPQED